VSENPASVRWSVLLRLGTAALLRQHRVAPVKTLILGAGNLLLSDEGFGVHFIRYLEQHHILPPNVELFDAGTLGLMIGQKLEEAERVYIIDVVDAPGTPGTCIRYTKEDFLLERIPIKLSPHQIGVQEMLLVSSLRGRCPEEIFLLGIIPCSVEPGTELSPLLQQRLPELAAKLVLELSVRNPPSRPWAAGCSDRRSGHRVRPGRSCRAREAYRAAPGVSSHP
jgi:hydrogenase maturation protease